MKSLILKLCTAYVRIRYPVMQYEYRYFIRDNYYSRLRQYKYLLNDYVYKKKYKTIHYNGEFQIEITHVLPFAYWHYLNGTLKKTVSCKNTKELYFFSENHEEKYEERDWTFNYNTYDCPNMTHSITKSYAKWAQVPLKEHYKNDLFVYDKPILVIANKYNIEWNKQPVNFFSIDTLDKIINTYKSKYQIIYNRPLSTHIINDNSEIMDLHEYPWLREQHPEVILMNDLYEQYRGTEVNNFNHLQLRVYANCSHFVSVHGGGSALASYFGGTNIIFSTGWMEAIFNEYATYWPAFSGAKVLHAINEEQVLQYLKENYA